MLLGWLIAIPVPFILLYAPSWNWVLLANMLLGISQGLTWSITVVIKIDLVGEKNRGFAMGLNEFAGYFSIGLMAYFTSFLANKYGVVPYPFYLGIVIALFGFMLSLLFIKDTAGFVKKESEGSSFHKSDSIFRDTTFRDKSLSSITQAGMINNLNDGMIWGLLPVLLISAGHDVGFLAAIYPTVWGISQLFTGKFSDHFSKKKILFGECLFRDCP